MRDQHGGFDDLDKSSSLENARKGRGGIEDNESLERGST